ncbi:conserved hypothetical protein [Beutenbergia cavernae DSM 12333]|uniref:Uncharacterized protein n=1 Tax=Beutenbergia cavernae (strain ATCC BAA-8 / DSM 12333 / CCUG 43141 / JCM 11478 / NBRC 16432 / NCIMB 13614 / HKI 0122) TaxID=471853 RepID=C5BZA9_BEUC1|nr:hypothetical protein [Beutenbergia cavernae]ACQ79081.1 conserved hypothetical protein [Beutenbergia cavernae DSM 12333]
MSSGSEATTPRALRPAGIAWRLAVTALVLVVLVVGQVRDTNDLFPFGSLSQYATARDMNGTVRSVYLSAEFADGTTDQIALNQNVVGVGRAEIEGQLDRIISDPSLLQGLADAHAALRPSDPQPTHLYLRRSIRQLEDGLVVGEPEIETLTEWEVER